MRHPIITLLLTVSLVATACGSGGDSGGGTDAAATTEGTDDATTDTAGDGDGDDASDADENDTGDSSAGSDDDASGNAGDAPSAAEIAEALFPSFEDFSGPEAEAQFADEQRAQEEAVATCMRDLGFEYTPVDYGSFAFFDGTDDLDPQSREWAETYGLGMSTFAFDESTFGDFGEDDFVDPNQEYVDGLTDSARDAYYEALFGANDFAVDAANVDEADLAIEDFEPQGCQGEAFEATSSFAGVDRVYQEFGDQLDDLYARVEADPRMREISDNWVTCMGAAGYTYSSPDDMYDEFSGRMDELFEETFGSFDEEFESGEEFDASDDIGGTAETEFEIPRPDADKLAALQDDEIAVALDSFDCGINDGFEVFEEIAAEYTDQFIADNLAALQAAIAEG